MKKWKNKFLFVLIISVLVSIIVFICITVGINNNQSNYLYSLEGTNDMSIEELKENAKMECKRFKNCGYLDDVRIELGEYNSVQIFHPDIEIEKSQSRMYDAVIAMLVEHVYLSKYIAENYEGCKNKPIKVAFNYKVNGLKVRIVNSTDDFDAYYSTGTDEEVFEVFAKKTLVSRTGGSAECESFDRALDGEQ